MNKVMLIGNVGQEPKVRYLDSGLCVASVSLATTERGYTLQNGTQVPERTEWHNLIFWRKQAETVEKYVHKGDKLYVEGKIQTRTYDDKKGIQHTTIDIIVENMEMLTPKSYGNPAGASLQQAPATSATPSATPQPIQPSAPTQQEEGPDYPF